MFRQQVVDPETGHRKFHQLCLTMVWWLQVGSIRVDLLLFSTVDFDLLALGRKPRQSFTETLIAMAA